MSEVAEVEVMGWFWCLTKLWEGAIGVGIWHGWANADGRRGLEGWNLVHRKWQSRRIKLNHISP